MSARVDSNWRESRTVTADQERDSNLTPPIFQVSYDMDTKRYVAQSVYEDGKALVTIAEGATFYECMENVTAWRMWKALGKEGSVPPELN